MIGAYASDPVIEQTVGPAKFYCIMLGAYQEKPLVLRPATSKPEGISINAVKGESNPHGQGCLGQPIPCRSIYAPGSGWLPINRRRGWGKVPVPCNSFRRPIGEPACYGALAQLRCVAVLCDPDRTVIGARESNQFFPAARLWNANFAIPYPSRTPKSLTNQISPDSSAAMPKIFRPFHEARTGSG